VSGSGARAATNNVLGEEQLQVSKILSELRVPLPIKGITEIGDVRPQDLANRIARVLSDPPDLFDGHDASKKVTSSFGSRPATSIPRYASANNTAEDDYLLSSGDRNLATVLSGGTGVSSSYTLRLPRRAGCGVTTLATRPPCLKQAAHPTKVAHGRPVDACTKTNHKPDFFRCKEDDATMRGNKL
jgi:hypothetical protein